MLFYVKISLSQKYSQSISFPISIVILFNSKETLIKKLSRICTDQIKTLNIGLSVSSTNIGMKTVVTKRHFWDRHIRNYLICVERLMELLRVLWNKFMLCYVTTPSI